MSVFIIHFVGEIKKKRQTRNTITVYRVTAVVTRYLLAEMRGGMVIDFFLVTFLLHFIRYLYFIAGGYVLENKS